MKWIENKLSSPDEQGWRFNYDYLIELTRKVNGTGVGNLSMEEVEAVLLTIYQESPLLSIEELAQKLRAANPFMGDIESIEDKRIGWNECIRKLLELSKQQP